VPDPLSVFEHEKLRIGERGFQRMHYERLLKWNEANGFKYFDAGPNSITFAQYVGVIQVDDLVIQVLPKADRDGDAGKWQRALLEMLGLVHNLPLTSTTESHLHKRSTSILDFFFDLYVHDVHGLVRNGLVKQYHRRTGNQLALKGRIHWPGHLRENLIRKERFHVEHQVYDSDHLLHSLLKRALCIVKDTALDPMIAGRVQDVEWAFEQVEDRTLNAATITRIRIGRKTQAYARAVQLATMIVLDHAPDIKGGQTKLLGLMFDMNVLYERVVLKLLQQAARETDLTISGQDSRLFWQRQKIRPDIVVRRGDEVVMIIDTKWKVPKDDRPADADLKQMYVYNLQYGAPRSILLYPSTGSALVGGAQFAEWDWSEAREHQCLLRSIDLFTPAGTIRKDTDAYLSEVLMLSRSISGL
jgi:5-methylcytosine-specific restriction enzyme subunit McrC